MICLMFFHSIGSLKKSDPFLTELERLILTLQLVHKFLFLNLQRTRILLQANIPLFEEFFGSFKQSLKFE